MTNETSPYLFAVIGAGWRTSLYMRVARAVPERFHVSGVVDADARAS